MGKFMSANLITNGFDVQGYDPNPKAVEGATAHGVRGCSSVAEVSKNVDYIVACLPNTKIVESVLHDDGGVF